MNISRRFIQYPVMTTLLMAAVVIFGIFGYAALPVSELPNVDFPTIQVSASLAGADPVTMAATIATPLESQFSVIPGIDQMTSSSSQGSTNIALQFSLDKNLGEAANDVQSAISRATRQLPRTMINPPSYFKVNPTELPVLSIALSSKTLPITTVDKYAEELLARRLSTLTGVAQVNVNGSQQYAVRVQADPGKLAVRNIGIDQLASAIAQTNIDQATGALNGVGDARIIHTNGQLMDADSYRRQIITYQNGAPVRIGDVANVIDSSNDTRSGSWVGPDKAIVLQINRQPGSNTIEVVDNIKKVLPQFRAVLPPSIKLETLYDRTQTIRASVDDVQTTLLIAAVLVVGVIFVFLRKVTATIIPSLALPIALIGTFAGMSLLGYSIDNLSLMALTLSVGFVVDDAIVMLENIVRHIEEGMKPLDAAMKGSSEIGFTILSMTLSLAAVFIPIVFMSGIVGRLLHEFAVTIITAIMFSGIISVTLTPMLCARFLKDEHNEKHNAFYKFSEDTFNKVQAAYSRTLHWSMAHKRTILGIFAGSLVASVVLFAVMPEDFLPTDDIGQLQVSLLANEGTSFDRMSAYAQYVNRTISADPNVYRANSRVGQGGLGSAGAYTAQIQVYLKPRDQRALSADEISRELRRKLTGIPGVNVFVVNPPTIRIGARMSRSSYQYTLEGLDLDQLRDVSARLETALKETPVFIGVSSDFDKPAPDVDVSILRERAAAQGVTPTQIENALSYAFGGQQVSQIYGAQNLYSVVLELLPQYQRNAASLRNLYVTGTGGVLVPLSAVTKVATSTIPVVVNHQGELPAVTLSFDLAPGYALSDAVTGIAKVSRDIGVPDSIQGSFQGTAAAFQQSTQNMGLLLLIAIIVVYIILGILYESFIHPFTILSGLPSAAVGALFTLYLAGLPLTLYAFVGMMMLIGIVKKNAIMMIDFALQKERGTGGSPEQAIIEAALVRFRPIMMTTMAAMMGTLPIVFGTGMGSESRRPLGLCVAGGLLFSQLLTLYITPVIYVYLDNLGHWLAHWRTGGQPAQVPAE
ncbi:MAG TPA: efflux RND transporter permease subunit [Rhizomicrobium sp.]|nr:efflux RND transporter permease subunit [Rhizomicrobium sp.]